MRPHLRLLPLAAAVAVLGPIVPSATAVTTNRIDYAVTIEGSAQYNRADVDDDTAAQHDEAVDFRSTVPRLSFYGTAAEDSSGVLGTASVRHGSYVITGGSGIQLRCASHELVDSTAGALDAGFEAGRTVFRTRVVEGFTVRVSGCNAVLDSFDVPFTSGGAPVGQGIFDGEFSVPHAEIGQGVITRRLTGAVTDGRCPGSHFNTALCSLTWEATVTFRRTGEELVDLGEVEPVPIVPDAEPRPPVPAPAPPAAAADKPFAPVLAKATLARSLSGASLPFRCAVACRGTVVATALRGGRALARGSFAAKAGAGARAAVRFDAADRRAIRRAGGVRLTLTARPAAGGTAVRRAVVVRSRR